MYRKVYAVAVNDGKRQRMARVQDQVSAARQ